MSKRAWAWIGAVPLVAASLSMLTLPLPSQTNVQWLTFVALALLATLAHLFEAEAPNRQSYSPSMVFFFASSLLIAPPLFVAIVVIAHIAELAKEWLINDQQMRAWYIQPFNIAVHILAGFAARWVHITLGADPVLFITPSSVLAGALAVGVYVILDHALIGMALVLARGMTWRETGIFDPQNVLSDLIQVCLGYTVAVLWVLNPWLILPALSPLVLMYRALKVPLLQREARIDAKTGLWNARHFMTLFTAELERAQRFNRPMAVIMADLDLLRNINNTYGHLAGDAVLHGVGQVIRQTIRDYDIAGRFGGEEFALVLPEVGPAEARALAERLRRAIETTPFGVATGSTQLHATMSLGVACFPADGTDCTALVHEADVAVYQAKLSGRNRVVLAADVPHSTKLEHGPVDDRLGESYGAAHAALPRPAAAPIAIAIHDAHAAGYDSATAGYDSVIAAGTASFQAAARRPESLAFRLFVGGIIGAGVGMALLGWHLQPLPDWRPILLFTALAAIAELLRVSVYDGSSVSVGAALIFAGALVGGMPGVVCVSFATAIAHHVRQHRSRTTMYTTLFNWAAHVLAGAAPVLALGTITSGPPLDNLPALVVPVMIAAVAYYLIETGLIATALSFAEQRGVVQVWHDHFRWLATHYAVLCLMGLLLGVAYHTLGISGVAVFTIPVLMMRFAQKQYLERTEASAQELRRMNAELAQANQEVTTASQAIRQINQELFLTLAKIFDARDPYVGEHAARVATYAAAIAQGLNLSPLRAEQVFQAGLLHDIGKIGIPEHILHKPSRLNRDEYELIKQHAEIGAAFLETSQSLRHLAPFVRHHHERWDGLGYPAQLAGEAIPLEARILAVCDAVEAMASDRPYRRALPLPAIVAEIRRCAGTHFDPMIVEVFATIIEREGEHLVVNSARELGRRRLDGSLTLTSPYTYQPHTEHKHVKDRIMSA